MLKRSNSAKAEAPKIEVKVINVHGNQTEIPEENEKEPHVPAGK